MANTPEFRAVSTSTGVLVDGIGVDVERYAEKFHDEELITDTEYNIALKSTTEVDDAHKARRIVQNIAAKVKARPPLFIELLRVLRELDLTELAKKVETKFLKYGGKLPKKITGASDRKRLPKDRESAEEDDSEVKRQCKAASRIQIDNQDDAEDEEAEIVVPTSLEDTNHIEKYKKAAGIILKANRDILKKDFPPGEHLCKVAEKIKSDWKTKFYLLNLEESDVNNIMEGRNRDNPVGQRQEALEIWRNKALPTYKNLLIVLIKGNWKDAEDVLVGLCTK